MPRSFLVKNKRTLKAPNGSEDQVFQPEDDEGCTQEKRSKDSISSDSTSEDNEQSSGMTSPKLFKDDEILPPSKTNMHEFFRRLKEKLSLNVDGEEDGLRECKDTEMTARKGILNEDGESSRLTEDFLKEMLKGTNEKYQVSKEKNSRGESDKINESTKNLEPLPNTSKDVFTGTARGNCWQRSSSSDEIELDENNLVSSNNNSESVNEETRQIPPEIPRDFESQFKMVKSLSCSSVVKSPLRDVIDEPSLDQSVKEDSTGNPRNIENEGKDTEDIRRKSETDSAGIPKDASKVSASAPRDLVGEYAGISRDIVRNHVDKPRDAVIDCPNNPKETSRHSTGISRETMEDSAGVPRVTTADSAGIPSAVSPPALLSVSERKYGRHDSSAFSSRQDIELKQHTYNKSRHEGMDWDQRHMDRQIHGNDIIMKDKPINLPGRIIYEDDIIKSPTIHPALNRNVDPFFGRLTPVVNPCYQEVHPLTSPVFPTNQMPELNHLPSIPTMHRSVTDPELVRYLMLQNGAMKEPMKPYQWYNHDTYERSAYPAGWDPYLGSRGFLSPSQVYKEGKNAQEGFNGTRYKCGLCGASFSLQRLLNRHMKTHSFYKRYHCQFCGKGFNDT
ncbi:uncharacterized protein LOC110246752, partial [Exaiptasia diaphana]|uniref:C2H2-type domain-containing protein n=1 Tax=Exaiptasia diaphana TaxID=2652724 RepID=A0A913XT30_EXADI